MRPNAWGPGLLLAATSIGASHILMSPEAGARFGFGLVWLVVLAHAIKYPAFSFASRYVAATDESLLDAYARAPGPKGWAIWLGIVDMSVQALGLIAALVGLTGSFLSAAFGGATIPWALAVAGLLLVALRGGQYRGLRMLNLVMMAVLSLGTLVAFLAAPPSAQTLATAWPPSVPPGSLLLVAAILGFMPTSVAVSVWQSLWTVEQRAVAQGPMTQGPERVPPTTGERLRSLRGMLLDLRTGYLVSAVLAVLFVSLGATLLQPRGLVPSGPAVATTLAQLYTLSLGAFMEPVFLAVALCALLSTCYTMMDGFPRAFVAAWRVRRRETSGRPATVDRRYWIFLLAATFGGMAMLAAVPDPAFLVEAVGAVGLVLSPVYFTLNLWAVVRRIDVPALRPGRFAVCSAILGIVAMTMIAGLLLWTTFLAAP